MIRWLFNSAGQPLAYVHDGRAVFAPSGRFVGWLTEGGDVFKGGRYVGTVAADRLLFDPTKAGAERPQDDGGDPFNPGMPYLPFGVGPRTLPDGFRDVDPPSPAG
jgi:hypothetical protein